MGGTRFVVGALQQILLKRKHAARVAVLEPTGSQPFGQADSAADGAQDGSSSMAADGLAAAAALPGPPVTQLAAFRQLAGGWRTMPGLIYSSAVASCRLLLTLVLCPVHPASSGVYNQQLSTSLHRLAVVF
jgi:hypothetical protein